MDESWEQERRDAQEDYQTLMRRFGALSERAMRREILGEYMLSQSPQLCVELLRLICLHSPSDPKAAQLMLAFQDQAQAQHKLGYDEIRSLYECARERGYHNVQRLFLSFAPSAPQEEESRLRGHPHLEELTLGERKFLARKLDIQMLEKLLLDPDPSVIRNLLRNPRITEREVLRMASKRPNRAEILEEIAQSSRWFSRYRVKTALAQNPYTPFAIGLQTLPFLQTPDLKRIAQSNNLHPQLSSTAEEFIRLRELPIPRPKAQTEAPPVPEDKPRAGDLTKDAPDDGHEPSSTQPPDAQATETEPEA